MKQIKQLNQPNKLKLPGQCSKFDKAKIILVLRYIIKLSIELDQFDMFFRLVLLNFNMRGLILVLTFIQILIYLACVTGSLCKSND